MSGPGPDYSRLLQTRKGDTRPSFEIFRKGPRSLPELVKPSEKITTADFSTRSMKVPEKAIAQ